MCDDDRYTIHPFDYTLALGTGYFIAGDMIDVISGDIIVGEYCCWPKREPKIFMITLDQPSIDIVEPMQNLKVLDRCVDDAIPFYMKLNNRYRKW